MLYVGENHGWFWDAVWIIYSQIRSRGCRRRTKISAIKIPPIAVELGILNAAHPGLHDSLIFNACMFDAGWWFGTCFYCFYFSVGNHYSNWRSHIFQRCSDNYHQTVMIFTPSNHRADHHCQARNIDAEVEEMNYLQGWASTDMRALKPEPWRLPQKMGNIIKIYQNRRKM